MEHTTEQAGKPKLKLVGKDGNAFSILGRARHVGRNAGWSEERLKAIIDEATSGDYGQVLAIMAKYFEVR